MSTYENWARCTKTGQLRSFGKNGIILNIRRTSGQSFYILKVSKYFIYLLSLKEISEIFVSQTKKYSDYKLKCTKSGQHTVPLQLILWEYIPRALKCFALASLDQQELFNFPSNALFCILEVWQGFIRTVVLRLLSHGTNFHSNKHIRNYTHDALQSKIGNFVACC